MPEGFAVQLDLLADFTTDVANTVTDYQQLTAQLGDADISPESKKNTLLSNPGHSGGPTDFYEASKDMLDSYGKLIGVLHQAHAAITVQFEHMASALGETHQLYAELDNTQANVFHGMLDGFPSDGS